MIAKVGIFQLIYFQIKTLQELGPPAFSDSLKMLSGKDPFRSSNLAAGDSATLQQNMETDVMEPNLTLEQIALEAEEVSEALCI